jgi:hypothetical protein
VISWPVFILDGKVTDIEAVKSTASVEESME